MSAQESLFYKPDPMWAREHDEPVEIQRSADNWFMQRVMTDVREGDPPTIIIGGKKRSGKSIISLKIAETIVDRCHEMKWAYRDKGLPTERRYDLRNAQFKPSMQVIYNLKALPPLLQPPPPLGNGLPYGSPIITDESSISLGVLSFNNPLVKQIAALHDSAGFRILPLLMNTPGSVLRVAYQFRETAAYFMQMKARGVAKVYAANPAVTGRVFLKTIGWLGYQNPFTKKIVARIGVPRTPILQEYNVVKDLNFRRQINKSARKIEELSAEGYDSPYDAVEEDAELASAAAGIMTLPKERKYERDAQGNGDEEPS